MYLTPLIATLLGLFICWYAAKGLVLHYKGTPMLGTNNQPIPLVVWPFTLFSGLMALAAGVPSLFGEPMWLLNKVFSLIAAL